MPADPDARTRPIAAVLFLIAAIVFLLVALLGDAGGDTVFLVLAMAFVVLSFNTWRR